MISQVSSSRRVGSRIIYSEFTSHLSSSRGEAAAVGHGEEDAEDDDDDGEGVCIFQRPTVIAKEQQQEDLRAIRGAECEEDIRATGRPLIN